jgi:transcriptional regulator of acetoin/glycerol metabolism
MHGLSPANAIPTRESAIDSEHLLLRAAAPVLDSRRAALNGFRAGLTLTDNSGRLLGRWVESSEFARRLDSRRVVPGMCISETVIGTNSGGIALETGSSALVVGHEHFSDGAVTMTTAGTAIRHPVTRRLLGSLNVACGVDDTNPLLLPWIIEVAGDIETRVLDSSSRRQRALFDTFLTSAQDSRHPVVCLDEDTVITNAAAARLLDACDHALIWEMASRQLDCPAKRTDGVALSTGHVVDVVCEPVLDGTRAVGALLRLTRVRSSAPTSTAPLAAPTPLPALEKLAGRSVAWRGFVKDLRDVWGAQAPILITGEPGTSKSTVATLLAEQARPTRVLDIAANPGQVWSDSLRDALQMTVGTVVILRADRLGAAESSAIARQLSGGVSPGLRVVATADVSDTASGLGGLMDWPGAIVVAPPLRERLDDLPDLLAAMTKRVRGADGPRWSAEAIQLLSRIAWPANLHSLQGLVRRVCDGTNGPVVLVKHLPARFVARASRRSLSGLEQVEAHAITAALHAARGNKREAADALGIARSTLYRKVRALGLDLSRATF